MSNLWFNLRILLWHFQIEKGRLFRLKASYNHFWLKWELLKKPMWLYEFAPRTGWSERNNWKFWKPWTTDELVTFINRCRK